MKCVNYDVYLYEVVFINIILLYHTFMFVTLIKISRILLYQGKFYIGLEIK